MTAPHSVPASVDESVNRVTLAERRSSRRRRLQGANDVSLHGTGSEVEWTGTGTLLNASPDGIACRVSAQTAHALAIGQRVHAVFRIGPTSTVFDLKARVINITPAGATHGVVLGMEFVADRRLKRVQTKLLESLRRAGDGAN